MEEEANFSKELNNTMRRSDYMGRKHTMYISDATWRMMQLLKQEEESMSAVIRKSIELANNHHIEYDAISELEKKKDILREYVSTRYHLIDIIENITDITFENLHAKQRLHKIKTLLEKEGYIE